eukprot:171195-Pyramimonas_sp.AAC.1
MLRDCIITRLQSPAGQGPHAFFMDMDCASVSQMLKPDAASDMLALHGVVHGSKAKSAAAVDD